MTDSTRFSFIDLFSGIGGIRLGLQRAGGYCVMSSEIDKHAIKTYEVNFGDKPRGDITQIPASEIPDHDLLAAGFPCQAFSQAGLKRGFEDERGNLFFEVVRILKEKHPKYFLLENVKHLRSHAQGKTLDVILKHLEQDYVVFYKVLNSRDFGVPQNRERIYFVGFRKDLGRSKFEFPVGTINSTKLGDILQAEHEIDAKYTLSALLWEGHKRRKDAHKKRGNGFGYSLFDANSAYVNTLTARYYKDGSEILISQESKLPRKLTPRECARLQGFPDEFRIPVSDTQAYKQFGNSVTVPVIEAIARRIIDELV